MGTELHDKVVGQSEQHRDQSGDNPSCPDASRQKNADSVENPEKQQIQQQNRSIQILWNMRVKFEAAQRGGRLQVTVKE